jgi:hypothetical protein
MRRFATVLVAAFAIASPAQAGTATPVGQAADCRFDDATTVERFGGIRVLRTDAGIVGCRTDVGRGYKLSPGRSASTLFGSGDWIALPRAGKLRAVNLRTGRTHSASAAGSVTALVVNFDGTLAWVADGDLRTKARRGSAKRIATGADANFLGLELEGCAVTWKAGGAQRSSGIFCANP